MIFIDIIDAVKRRSVFVSFIVIFLLNKAFVWYYSDLFQVALATFAIYVLSGNELTANKAFVALSLFNILRYPITMFPNIIVSMIQVS